MYGVKGKSVLHGLTEFDIIDGDPIDYMHCVLLGVVRTFTSLWFESKHHNEPWSVRVILSCERIWIYAYFYVGTLEEKLLRQMLGFSQLDLLIA